MKRRARSIVGGQSRVAAHIVCKARSHGADANLEQRTDVIPPRAEQHRIRVHVRVITGLLVRAIPREDLIERDVRRADWREQEERDDDVHGGVAPRSFGFETSIIITTSRGGAEGLCGCRRGCVSTEVESSPYPPWATLIGWLLALGPTALAPCCAVYALLRRQRKASPMMKVSGVTKVSEVQLE